jgi:hypothetical protein
VLAHARDAVDDLLSDAAPKPSRSRSLPSFALLELVEDEMPSVT